MSDQSSILILVRLRVGDLDPKQVLADEKDFRVYDGGPLDPRRDSPIGPVGAIGDLGGFWAKGLQGRQCRVRRIIYAQSCNLRRAIGPRAAIVVGRTRPLRKLRRNTEGERPIGPVVSKRGIGPHG